MTNSIPVNPDSHTDYNMCILHIASIVRVYATKNNVSTCDILKSVRDHIKAENEDTTINLNGSTSVTKSSPCGCGK